VILTLKRSGVWVVCISSVLLVMNQAWFLHPLSTHSSFRPTMGAREPATEVRANSHGRTKFPGMRTGFPAGIRARLGLSAGGSRTSPKRQRDHPHFAFRTRTKRMTPNAMRSRAADNQRDHFALIGHSTRSHARPVRCVRCGEMLTNVRARRLSRCRENRTIRRLRRPWNCTIVSVSPCRYSDQRRSTRRWPCQFGGSNA
jgi:hypothetical protein